MNSLATANVAWPLLICVAGLVGYVLFPERIRAIGLVAFACGLFHTVALLAHARW